MSRIWVGLPDHSGTGVRASISRADRRPPRTRLLEDRINGAETRAELAPQPIPLPRASHAAAQALPEPLLPTRSVRPCTIR